VGNSFGRGFLPVRSGRRRHGERAGGRRSPRDPVHGDNGLVTIRQHVPNRPRGGRIPAAAQPTLRSRFTYTLQSTESSTGLHKSLTIPRYVGGTTCEHDISHPRYQPSGRGTNLVPLPWPSYGPHLHPFPARRSMRTVRSRLIAAATSCRLGRAKSPGCRPSTGRRDSGSSPCSSNSCSN
jgi:hypothetical protein